MTGFRAVFAFPIVLEDAFEPAMYRIIGQSPVFMCKFRHR